MIALIKYLYDYSVVHGGQDAIVHEGNRVSYRELTQLVDRMALALRERGVERGDRVGLFLPSQPLQPITYLALQRLGATPVIINFVLSRREVKYIAKHCEMSTLITVVSQTDILEAEIADFERPPTIVGIRDEIGKQFVAPLEPSDNSEKSLEFDLLGRCEDIGDIMYTSGTTGKPKGVALRNVNLLFRFGVAGGLYELRPGDRVATGLPLFNDFGLHSVMLPTLYHGGTCIFDERFDADRLLDTMAMEKATCMAGVPTMYLRLTQAAERRGLKLDTLRIAVSAGGTSRQDVIDRFEKIAPNAMITDAYGTTEAGFVTGGSPRPCNRRVGSVGRPLPGQQIRLLDSEGNDVASGEVGEIAVRSLSVTWEYLADPKATADAWGSGWFRMGDLLRSDEDGYLYFVDRSKDMIVCGGNNIYPREVEDLLHELPAIETAAVVGIPDEELEEVPKAFVTLTPGAVLTENQVISYLRENLATYKVPRSVSFIDELPLSPTGKILKRQLVEP